MSIPDLITSFLEIGVISRVEILVKFLLIATIFDANLEDLLRCLCICKVKRRSAVELDILRRKILSSIEHFTLHVEDLHTKTSRLRNAVIDAGISCFGAITYGNMELSGLREEFCLSEMGRQVAHDKLSFDKSLCSGMCSWSTIRYLPWTSSYGYQPEYMCLVVL
jgi:hypothetical protein